jgi:tight adherence protein B
MRASIATYLMGYGGSLLVVLGLTYAFYVTLMNPETALRKRLTIYEKWLDEEIRFQLWKTTGAAVARIQVGVFAFTLTLALAFINRWPLLMLLPPIVAFFPRMYILSQHVKRIEQLEILLDSWLLLLANALKASPSLGEAIENSARLIRPPVSEEVDLVIKEMRLGTPIDQAVLNMSKRINSRVVSGALTTILVGRQTGGDLPGILEQSASTLREMQRLEGVVRTKTAEGRMQAWVIGAMPYIMVGILHYMDPHFMDPLLQTVTGNIMLGFAIVIWLAAIILARRILAVDI